MLISKNHLRARHTVSKDTTRPVLNVIDVQQIGDEVVAASTDGYVLTEVREHMPDESDFPDVLDSPSVDHVRIIGATAQKMNPALKPNRLAPILGYGRVTQRGIVTTDLERTVIFSDAQVEGNFPDYQSLIPVMSDAKVIVKVQPELLAKALKAFDGLGAVTIELHGDMKPVVMRSVDGDVDVTGVVMPLKA